jgi:hypothetical protein
LAKGRIRRTIIICRIIVNRSVEKIFLWLWPGLFRAVVPAERSEGGDDTEESALANAPSLWRKAGVCIPG